MGTNYSKMVKEPLLEKENQSKNALLNKTIRLEEKNYSKHLSSIKTLISMSSK